ncbi:hypothetical protein QTG54_006853 [Skeletonema marinoi]|uniref:Uncharacterized protein n=1 Tax=Skeletonema marinoi TaxID=267567 RepID=A0AAD9DE18_9STRA|nr:hypothetical protein QTG54_006853 [Skeletonema marinoi]
MQDNEERRDGEGCWKEKGKAVAAADSRDEATEDKDESSNMIIVPTKTEDGGSTITNQVRAYINNNNLNRGQQTTRPDAFQMYSDNDSRMMMLLGIEPASNPNEGEREDWRQLTGFAGIGEERRRSNDGTTPRRTRLSFELHLNAFENMWIERGELNLEQPLQQQHGQQEQDGQPQ